MSLFTILKQIFVEQYVIYVRDILHFSDIINIVELANLKI